MTSTMQIVFNSFQKAYEKTKEQSYADKFELAIKNYHELIREEAKTKIFKAPSQIQSFE